MIIIRIKDNGSSRAIHFTSQYRAGLTASKVPASWFRKLRKLFLLLLTAILVLFQPTPKVVVTDHSEEVISIANEDDTPSLQTLADLIKGGVYRVSQEWSLFSSADAQTYYKNPSVLFGNPLHLQPTDDFIPVILSWGQSNEIGRAEYDRYEKMTKYTYDIPKVQVYYKTDYTATDNGNFFMMQTGSIVTKEPDASGTTRHYGSYVVAAYKLSEMLNKTVYVIPTADGGTIVNTTGAFRSWHPTITAECFDVAMDRYYAVALAKLQAANPGKRIVVWIMVTEGETDASQGRTQLQFFNDITAIMTDMRSYDQLASAPLFASKINYLQTAGEATINAAWEDYRAANASLVRLIETSDLPRKIDLTTTQKGGITATSTDDEHLSYIGQNTKGERDADAVFDYYGWTKPTIDAPSTNTGYSTSTLSANHVRLQCTDGKVTRGTDDYKVSALTNDLSTGTFSSVTGNVFLKEESKKWWLFTPNLHAGVANTPRIQTSAAVGTTLFNHSFSWSCWVRPRDGQPTAAYTLIQDLNSTGSPTMRFYVQIGTDGKIYVNYMVSSVSSLAVTASAVFADNLQTSSKHIAVTLTSGDAIRIYVNGVLQTLDATNNGNLSAITMANYVNGTNVLTLMASRTGASSYSSYFFGHLREMTIQPVVYSTTDIANLMLNFLFPILPIWVRKSKRKDRTRKPIALAKRLARRKINQYFN